MSYYISLICKTHFFSIPASKDKLSVSKYFDKSKVSYREAIGSLLFTAIISRPDIEFAVNYASQFVESYDQKHWKFVQKILRYLIGKVDFGITFRNSGRSFYLQGFTDADYAGCLDTQKSGSGFVFFYNGVPISWSSQLQRVVLLSTAKAEDTALSRIAKEAVWTRQFLIELNINCNTIKIFVDNQAAIQLASNA